MQKIFFNFGRNFKKLFAKFRNEISEGLILINSPWGGPWGGSNPDNKNDGSAKSSGSGANNSSSGGSIKGQNQSGSGQNSGDKQADSRPKNPQNNGGDSGDKKTSGNSGDNNSNDKKGSGFKSNSDNNSEFFDPLKKLSQKFDNFFRGDGPKRPDEGFSKANFGLIALGAVLLWLSFGFYKVDPEENAVTLYFGKFYKIAQPGLNYHIPYPFGQVIKKSVITVNTEEFGFSSVSEDDRDSEDGRNFNAESLMLTGDENIVDVQFQVQWQIADIQDFVFNIAQPNESIRKSAESVMREVIAQTPIVEALSDGKQGIEQKTKILLQEVLDSYKAGVRVVMVQLRRVDPPAQVINAFRDVQTAKADKEREINESQAYANDIIPRARGIASQMKEESEAYAKQVVANSQGEASRFLSVYNQYVKSKQVTKRRIYLETMEKIYSDMDKIYIDKGAAKSFFGQLPINDLGKSSASSTSELKPVVKK